jgi:hypothetical protein
MLTKTASREAKDQGGKEPSFLGPKLGGSIFATQSDVAWTAY